MSVPLQTQPSGNELPGNAPSTTGSSTTETSTTETFTTGTSTTGTSTTGSSTSGTSRSARSVPAIDALALDDVRRTVVVAGGTVLGLLPLRTVFDDTQWLIEAVGAVILVIGPAAVLRLRRGPRAAQLLPGLVLVLGYAVVLYLHSSAIHGVLPWRESWHVLGQLRRQATSQVAENVAPMTSTRALRIQIVPGLALVAAVIDYLAVVRRSPALAGIPLLALFTICGASAGTSVGWFAFTGAAAGFLLILSADARINLLRWGRIIPRRSGEGPGVPRLALSGRRIGVLALLLALVVPLGVPGLSRNLLASAFHQQSGSGGGGTTGTGLSPFAGLRGSLSQGKIIELMAVHVTGSTNPLYLRSKVLDEFTATGWKASGAKDVTLPLGTGALVGDQPRGPSVRFTAQVRVSGLSDTAVPTFASLQSLRGLSGDWTYSVQQSTVAGGRTARDLAYTETVAQPNPSPANLRAADGLSAPAFDSRWSALPASVPAQVRTLVADLTAREYNAYDRARALNNFFTDPASGFLYDLQTKAGDSDSDLVNFLTNRTGFCQQYAAALAVMLRVSNIPARVVLGYTHEAANKQGNFTVTNHDAHSWVEAYLPQIGWLPFDPTPIDPSRASTLVYAPRPTVANAPASALESKPHASIQRPSPTTSSAAPAAAASKTSDGGVHLTVPAWLRRVLLTAAVLTLALMVLPIGREVQRRIRLRNAHQSGSAEPLWTELAASARDSGAGWSTSLTPRQVPGWLAGLGITDSTDVTRLARRVESERYAAAVDQSTSAELRDYGRTVAAASTQLSHRLDRWRRLTSWLLPASLVRRR